jgi:uncharacterized repeat protein (TIGR04052 family)
MMTKRSLQTAALGVALATVFARTAVAHIDVPGLDANGQCVGDANSDAAVTINELIVAVNNALNGCARLPITLNFRGMIGAQAFACGTIFTGIGTGSSQFIPSDFRFYVSNVKLITAAGDAVPLDLDQDGVWQYQNVALLDFETGPDNGCGEGNTATNTAVHGTVPAGVYTGVAFDLGLPFDLNHGDASTAPSPLNFTAMFWSWNDGYKFLRVDTIDDKFRMHLGSTGCDGGSPSRPAKSCAQPNVATITLTGFNPSHSVIVADLAALLADSNIDANQANTPPGCMSDINDQDCAPLFHNLGLTFPGGTSSGTQKMFRLSTAAAGGEHVEIKVATTADNGGALLAHPEFDLSQPIPLSFDECFGGTGDDCTGGTRLYSAVNPGIEPLDESEPDDNAFTPADGVPVTLEVTAIDTGLSVRFGDVVLDHVGSTVLLGTTPSFHADLETQLMLPGGTTPDGTFSVTFKLTTTSAQYQPSSEFTVRFTPTAAGSAALHQTR